MTTGYKRGFTLLEVMMALFLFGLVFLMGLRFVPDTTRALKRSDARAFARDRAELAALEHELARPLEPGGFPLAPQDYGPYRFTGRVQVTEVEPDLYELVVRVEWEDGSGPQSQLKYRRVAVLP